MVRREPNVLAAAYTPSFGRSRPFVSCPCLGLSVVDQRLISGTRRRIRCRLLLDRIPILVLRDALVVVSGGVVSVGHGVDLAELTQEKT